MIQAGIVVVLVAACAFWLGRKLIASWRGRSGCGCDHCPVAKPPRQP